MNENQSKKTIIVALAVGSLLDTHLSLSKASMDEDEFNDLKRKIGLCMGKIHQELLSPLWKSTPELLPKKLGGSYQVDETFLMQAIELCKRLHVSCP